MEWGQHSKLSKAINLAAARRATVANAPGAITIETAPGDAITLRGEEAKAVAKRAGIKIRSVERAAART